jgi:hypothetical protein
MSRTAADLAPAERAALRRCRRAATLLDEAVRVPGTRFRVGIDAVVGLLPVAGDVITAVLSLYIVAEAYRLGAPAGVLLRMALNLVLDLAVGSVPLVGDLFDAVWKANSRNLSLLENHLGV